MNSEIAPTRRWGLRARHLFFAAALVVMIGAVLLAVQVKSRPIYIGGGGGGSGGIVLPYSPPAFVGTDHRTTYRTVLLAGGAAVALLLAGIGLAVDRR